MATKINRRTFVQGTTTIGGLGMLRRAHAKAAGSNERVRLGVIGVGNRGDQLLDAFMPHKDAEIVAICDVYRPYLDAARAKIGDGVQQYHDYRKLLDRTDIDAVVIATPDHWHALQFVEACRAGKDVYVEKPLGLCIDEGRKMVEVAQSTGRIVQVGLHRRSAAFIREAVERVRRGEIGKVTAAHCYNYRNEYPMGIGKPLDCEPPADLDWDLWLGPAPKVAYNPSRCLYKFRWFWDYSGGQVTNMGCHYLDLIQWALGQEAPRSVVALGGNYAVDDCREIPDTMEVIWQYDGALVTFSQCNANGFSTNPRGWDIELRGSLGTMGIRGNGYEIVPEHVRERDLPALSPIARGQNKEQAAAVQLARAALSASGDSDTVHHARNFLDCIRSRAATNCPIEVGNTSTTTTLLANLSLRLGRLVHWDAKAARVVDDPEANQLLSYEYRKPWQL